MKQIAAQIISIATERSPYHRKGSPLAQLYYHIWTGMKEVVLMSCTASVAELDFG